MMLGCLPKGWGSEPGRGICIFDGSKDGRGLFTVRYRCTLRNPRQLDCLEPSAGVPVLAHKTPAVITNICQFKIQC